MIFFERIKKTLEEKSEKAKDANNITDAIVSVIRDGEVNVDTRSHELHFLHARVRDAHLAVTLTARGKLENIEINEEKFLGRSKDKREILLATIDRIKRIKAEQPKRLAQSILGRNEAGEGIDSQSVNYDFDDTPSNVPTP